MQPVLRPRNARLRFETALGSLNEAKAAMRVAIAWAYWKPSDIEREQSRFPIYKTNLGFMSEYVSCAVPNVKAKRYLEDKRHHKSEDGNTLQIGHGNTDDKTTRY